jgi:hypothetical protein
MRASQMLFIYKLRPHTAKTDKKADTLADKYDLISYPKD